MIRFIIRVKNLDSVSGAAWEQLATIDADVPELERALRSGGRGENCYELVELVGAEVLETNDEN